MHKDGERPLLFITSTLSSSHITTLRTRRNRGGGGGGERGRGKDGEVEQEKLREKGRSGERGREHLAIRRFLSPFF